MSSHALDWSSAVFLAKSLVKDKVPMYRIDTVEKIRDGMWRPLLC